MTLLASLLLPALFHIIGFNFPYPFRLFLNPLFVQRLPFRHGLFMGVVLFQQGNFKRFITGIGL